MVLKGGVGLIKEGSVGLGVEIGGVLDVGGKVIDGGEGTGDEVKKGG